MGIGGFVNQAKRLEEIKTKGESHIAWGKEGR